MAILYIGIGSNIGDKKKNCEDAIRRLGENGIEVVKVSKLYVTRPLGGPLQEDYLNGVIMAATKESPQKSLKIFKDIEEAMGRTPAKKDHPRIIDLDILMYDDIALNSEELVIPHPRMHQREFVLRGFVEIAPDAMHPVLHRSIAELFSQVAK